MSGLAVVGPCYDAPYATSLLELPAVEPKESKLSPRDELDAYLSARILGIEDDDSNDDDVAMEEDEEDEEEDKFETQLPQSTTGCDKKAPRIPCVTKDCHSVVHRIEHLDLYTQEAQLGWLEIVQKSAFLTPSKPVGPLGCAFDHVCVLRLQQSVQEGRSSNILLFAYDNYAKRLASLVAHQDSLCLPSVPAASIFPYQPPPLGGSASESNVCLCLASATSQWMSVSFGATLVVATNKKRKELRAWDAEGVACAVQDEWKRGYEALLSSREVTTTASEPPSVQPQTQPPPASTQPTKPPSESSRTVEYTRLKDLSRPNTQIHVQVYVLSFGACTRSRRGDWMVRLSVVDASLPETPIPALLFASQPDQLPPLRQAGDVLQLHGVHLTEFQQDWQLVGRKGSWSYVVNGEGSQELQDWGRAYYLESNC